MRRRRTISSQYKSGLEERAAAQITDAGLSVQYEVDKISYTVPERQATYRPDFKLPSQDGGFFYVETKGRWDVDDRQKHLLIKSQHPNLDIRFVFASDNRIYKRSPTRYSQWCDLHGFQYAMKRIPDEWLSTEGEKNEKPEGKDTGSPD